MLKGSTVCLSALSKRTKRVQVQILRDFPAVHLYKGQLSQVKPSLMTNYLYNYNGAKYIMKPEDVDQELLAQYEAQQAKERAQRLKMQEIENASREAQALRVEKAAKQQEQLQKKNSTKKRKSILDSGLTVKDVRIPGLDI